MPVLGDIIRNSVLAYRDELAVLDLSDGCGLSYSEFATASSQLSGLLFKLGLRSGDRVGILQRNTRHWPLSEAAVATVGMVAIPINVYLSPREIAFLLDHSESKAVLFSQETIGLLRPIAEQTQTCKHFILLGSAPASTESWFEVYNEEEWQAADGMATENVDPSDPERIMYTSATTGVPKGVLCPHEVICDAVLSALANQLADSTSNDRFLATTPLTHVANSFFWAFFARGAATVMVRRFDPADFCTAVCQHNVTHTFLAPTLLIMLLDYLEARRELVSEIRASSLRAIWYGGSSMPKAVAQQAERVFGPIMNQQYGLTELYSTHPAMAVTQLTAEWHSKKSGSCGRPLIGSAVRIVDDQGREMPVGELGEITVRCHGRVAGYWRLPEGTEGAFRDGWLHTGDIGCLDEEGFLYVRDRKADLIISGGLNIYPAEIEDALSEHPGVGQCTVVGVPDPKWIEVPHAVVVKRPNFPDLEASELIAFMRKRIAHYKVPKEVIFREDLPVSDTGKVLRRVIRDALQQALTTERSDASTG